MKRPGVGDKIAGRYQIRSVAAERSNGLLFRGHDEQIGVEVALRFVDEGLLVGEEELQKFLARVMRARTLQHPNLMRLYDVVVDDGAIALVMQWAPGERLSKRLLGGPLPLADARLVLRRVAAGMAHAHSHGVVLGAVRPDTIILYEDGLKLTNVGIGPALPRTRYLEEVERRSQSDSLPPEVLRGEEPDERSDLYSLALLAKTLVMTAPESSAPRALETTRPVIERALSVDPSKRPRDAETFARELDAAIEGRNAPLDASTAGNAPAVSTSKDTEQVPKLDPPTSGSLEGMTRRNGPTSDPKPESSDGGLTNPRAAKPAPTRDEISSPENELSLDEMIEVPLGAKAGDGSTIPLPRVPQGPRPEITDVGHRSAIAEDEGAITDPELSREAVAPPPVVAAPIAPPPAIAEPLVPTPRPGAPAPRPRPRPDDSDNFATLEHARLPPPERLPSLSEQEAMFVTASAKAQSKASGRFAVITVIVGLTVGVVGATALSLLARPPATVIVVAAAPPTAPAPPAAAAPRVVTAAPPAVAVTPTVPQPVVVSTPVATPIATPINACQLGMAELTTPHHFCIDQYEYPGGRTIPRTMIALRDATQVCAGRGLRLCSDAEWEQACRGPSGASYPYGQHFDGQRCNTGGKTTPQAILPAGTLAHCRSQAGAYDMSGNVSEWTASGAVRGGSSVTSANTSRCSHVVRGADQAGAADVGFRCCGDLR